MEFKRIVAGQILRTDFKIEGKIKIVPTCTRSGWWTGINFKFNQKFTLLVRIKKRQIKLPPNGIILDHSLTYSLVHVAAVTQFAMHTKLCHRLSERIEIGRPVKCRIWHQENKIQIF